MAIFERRTLGRLVKDDAGDWVPNVMHSVSIRQTTFAVRTRKDGTHLWNKREGWQNERTARKLRRLDKVAAEPYKPSPLCIRKASGEMVQVCRMPSR